jgi:hypothetical protein
LLSKVLSTLRKFAFVAAIATLFLQAPDFCAAQSTRITGIVPINPTMRNRSTARDVVVLAQGGKALLPVVISGNASEAIRGVADDLAKYLGKISGAKFEVQTGDGARGIVLGNIKDFPHPNLNDALRINGFEGKEAFAIRTTPGRVLLLGATDLGASDAAYRMLDELGCRWLTPHPNWEVIPSTPDLRWSLDITDRPQIISRSIWWHAAFGSEAEFPIYRAAQAAAGQSGKGWSANAEGRDWKRRNNHNSSLAINAGHNWHSVILANKAAFDAHDEYWPLINGRRVRGNPLHLQPDIGNPEVRKMFVQYARDYFTKNSNADMVALDANDGGAFSQSPEFKALGTISDAVFGMANEVARMLQKEFPGKMVGVYSYREHSDLPHFALEPNVHVQFTGLIMASEYSRKELLQQWAAAHANMGFYDYYAAYEWFYDQLAGANAADMNYLANRIREEVQSNAVSIDGQSSNSWFLLGLGHSVANRLMWDPNQDAEKLRHDFLQSAFGPATETMTHFYDLWRPENSPIISRNLIYAMYLDLQKAEREARQDTGVLARLNDIKQYLRFIELDTKLKAIPKTAPYEEREKAFIKLFQHIYRTRFTYSTHYYLATQFLWQQRAEAAGIVLVTPGKPKETLNKELLPLTPAPQNPWKRINVPYTPQEIEANFASGLEYFKSPVVEEQTYSEDLVPIDWSKTQDFSKVKPLSTQWYIQGSTVRYAIYSPDGQPLKISIRPSVLNGNIAARPYTLRDATGKVILEDSIRPNDPPSTPQQLELRFPKPGVYVWEITDASAGFLWLEIPETATATIFLKRKGDSEQGPAPRPFRYLYVPRGTKEIQYFFTSWTNKHKVIAPDGRVLYEGPNTDGYNTLAVPPGMDGKVWAFDVRLGQFWPANLPPFFALSPEKLMVPREVAKNDGLEILQP